MTSDQQDSDLNNAVNVQKTGKKLNPNADAFFYNKALTPSVDKNKESGEPLTNGDIKQDDLKGVLSGESLVTDIPASPLAEPPQDIGSSPTVSTRDPEIGMAAMPGGAEAAISLHNEAVQSADQQDKDKPTPSVKLVGSTVPMSNGFEHGQTRPDSAEGSLEGTQSPEASSIPVSQSELRNLLLHQLEYYFSRENLVQDHYLQSQMDGDQYVSISIIANFNQVVKLTRDYDLIVEMLKSSKLVQVDNTGTKVRPKHNRSVLMLREIPDNTMKWEVDSLFKHEKCPKVVSCEFAHNGYWYVTFNTDEDATAAYIYLREQGVKFRDKPVLARIKAKPLMRAGGGGGVGGGGGAPYAGGNLPNGQPQHEAPPMPFMQQQPMQFPVMATPMSQFNNQQQITQAIPQFQLYNYQAAMLPQWGAGNNTPHSFLDPGAMLAMNGYQATSIKPSTNHSRNVFHPIHSNNNRGMAKPHHRPHSVSMDKMMDSRPVDRPHTTNTHPSHMHPRNNNHHAPELHPLLPSFGRSRSEGSPGSGRLGNALHGSGSAPPMPLVPDDRLPLKAPPLPPPPPPLPPSNRTYPVSAAMQQRRGTNYRRPRRSDEGARSPRSHPHGDREEKHHEVHFDLEASSFPPLPGSTNNSSTCDAAEGNKLSDVVRGTATHPHSRPEEVKAAPAPSTVTSTPLAYPAAVTTAASTSMTSGTPSHPAARITTSASPKAAGAVPVPATPSSVGKEAAEGESHRSMSQSVQSTGARSHATQSSAFPSTAGKISSQSVSPAAARSVEDSPSAPRQASVNTAPPKQNQGPSAVPAPTCVNTVTTQEAVSAKLSYAQMVSRKQQGVNSAKPSVENGIGTQATPVTSGPATQCTTQEQTQPSTPVSSAPSKPTIASASAQQSGKETTNRNFESKQQRFQGNRWTKEYRDNRRPRFDRHQSDYDMKVLAK